MYALIGHSQSNIQNLVTLLQLPYLQEKLESFKPKTPMFKQQRRFQQQQLCLSHNQAFFVGSMICSTFMHAPKAISTPKTITMLIIAINQGLVVTGPISSPHFQH